LRKKKVEKHQGVRKKGGSAKIKKMLKHRPWGVGPATETTFSEGDQKKTSKKPRGIWGHRKGGANLEGRLGKRRKRRNWQIAGPGTK